MGNLIGRVGNLIARLLQHHKPEPEQKINLADLPESCISAILSFTTLRDVCRLSAVSKVFASAADFDDVWSRWLPQQCMDRILSKAVSSVEFSSKRELYFRLCDSILIDGGTKMFWLERSTAKMGYMLSAKELTITWGDDQRYWRWVSGDDSRFSELAELKAVCWLEVRGRIDCRLLSANTVYRVVFALKFGKRAYGWNELPIKFSVAMPDGKVMESIQVLVKRKMVPTHVNEEDEDDDDEDAYYYDDGGDYSYCRDGWMEVVAGEFTVREKDQEDDYCCSDVEFCMKEVDAGEWKAGLLIDGVRIEPKCQ